jgi:hypothetical protein
MELPSEPVRRAVVQRYADLSARLRDEIGERPLVLPTADFFPDAFSSDDAGLQRLVTRMQRHAGLDDIPIRATVVGDDEPKTSSSCSSGACSVPVGARGEAPRLVDTGEHWELNVPAPELGAPVVLTTMIARALGRVFLVETAAESVPEPVDVTADLAAVLLGFGPLMLEGSYIYSKSCGGPQVGQATHLGVGDLALATALFIALGQHPHRPALKELGTTQKALLVEAIDWTKSNPAMIRQLAASPERVARGEFQLADTKPWLLRVFGKRKPEGPHDLPDDFTLADLEALAPTTAMDGPRRVAKPDPARDELSALVAEALTEAHSDAE